jgi:hypothetical protein
VPNEAMAIPALVAQCVKHERARQDQMRIDMLASCRMCDDLLGALDQQVAGVVPA